MPSKGRKTIVLVGGNPMNKIYFCFLLSVHECLHNFASVMIVFFAFQLVFVSLGSSWVIVDMILLKNENFSAQENNFQKS